MEQAGQRDKLAKEKESLEASMKTQQDLEKEMQRLQKEKEKREEAEKYVLLLLAVCFCHCPWHLRIFCCILSAAACRRLRWTVTTATKAARLQESATDTGNGGARNGKAQC